MPKKKATKGKAKPKATPESTPKKYHVGDTVEAAGEDGKFYDATVTAVSENGSYKVDFDGTNESAIVNQIKNRDGPEKKKPVTQSPVVKKPVAKKKVVGKKQATPSPNGGEKSPRQTRSQSSPSKLAPNHSPSPKSLNGGKSKEKTPAKGSPAKGSPKVSLSKQFKLAEKQTVPSSPKRGRGQAKPGLPARTKGKKPQQKWNIGDNVEALWDDGRMYAARIEKINVIKGGHTYDIRFSEDKIVLKGRKASQIQSPDDDEEEEEEEEEEEVVVEEKSRSRSSSPSKRKKVEDEEYVEGEKIKVNAEDFEVIASSSSEEDSDYEKKPLKRKRPPTSPKKQPTLSKKRRTELREGITKLKKDQIINLVFETAEKKPGMYLDLEKSFAGQKKIAKK